MSANNRRIIVGSDRIDKVMGCFGSVSKTGPMANFMRRQTADNVYMQRIILSAFAVLLTPLQNQDLLAA